MSDNKKVPPIFVGKMWSENEGTILASGNIYRWEHKDMDKPPKRYIKVIKSVNNTGQTKIEVLQSIGLLFDNTNDPNRRKNSPDIGGGVTVDTVLETKDDKEIVEWVEAKFGAWLQSDAEYAGDQYSISISKKLKQDSYDEPKAAPIPTAPPTFDDDDTPF